MRRLDHGEGHHAERGQDVVLERASVDAGGMGVAVLRDVSAQVTGGEVSAGGAGLGRGRYRLPAALDAVDDLGCAEPGLRGGELAVGTEGDALRPAPAPALHDIDLPPRGVDPDPEARELPVPEDLVLPLHREAVHPPPAQRQLTTTRHSRQIPTRRGG